MMRKIQYSSSASRPTITASSMGSLRARDRNNTKRRGDSIPRLRGGAAPSDLRDGVAVHDRLLLLEPGPQVLVQVVEVPGGVAVEGGGLRDPSHDLHLLPPHDEEVRRDVLRP